MENPNRFDLEQALRAWRADCASRPGISFDNARELESDLRDRVADLLNEGLTECEAFSKAVGQVGSPGELAREFGRENPLAVWRQRLFWIVAAGFGVSVWVLLTDGSISWCVNTFHDLLPLPGAAWFPVAGNLPLLAVAVLLATGRLQKAAAPLRSFGRLGLAFAGLSFLAAGLAVRLFGPSPLTTPDPLLLKVVALSLWPLLLLSLAVGLFRPAGAAEPGTSALGGFTVPATVWRERVFWMAVGGLAYGIWRTVTWVSIQALFYTGDINKPFSVAAWVFISSYLIIELSPLMFLGFLLRQRMRGGRDITAGKLVRSRAMFAVIPVIVCAWTALHLWSNYHWRPAGVDVSWSSIAGNYFATFRWLWPAGLACLILWLAPRGDTQKRPFAAVLE